MRCSLCEKKATNLLKGPKGTRYYCIEHYRNLKEVFAIISERVRSKTS